jgi:hypothetical protein
LDAAKKQQEKAQTAIRAISTVYHPFCLDTGAPRNAKQVSKDLEAQFATLHEVAKESSLSEPCQKRLDKAQRVLPGLVATIAFFHLTVQKRIEALGLPAKMEKLLYQALIPGLYIQRVAQKAQTAEQRKILRTNADRLLTPLFEDDSPIAQMEEEERAIVLKVAQECADLLERSSSPVEGRNGQLSLRHHSFHHLSPRKRESIDCRAQLFYHPFRRNNGS